MYTSDISRTKPTAFLFIIDQSGSMDERLETEQTKAQFVADVLNDLPPEAPSFIMRVCGFGFHILRRQFGQAHRARSPQIAQALGALLRVFGSPAMNAV